MDRSDHPNPSERRPTSNGRRAGNFAPANSPLARAPTAALGSSGSGPGGRADIPLDARGKPAFGPVKRFGDFTLIKKLATGGMAEIWLARQTGIAGFARFLVVKKILSHLAEQDTFVRMFQDEARTSALLSHPNVVQIHDLGRAEGTYYIAMEYIAGENLAAIAWRGMKRGRPFPPSFAAKVIADACKALHYAHTLRGNDGRPLGIVHRDVSPQNILVTYEGEVKVVDFGIAKAATKTEHTKTGMLKGKFSYMSPEQCLGADIDHRSDIFALGILLYELCTGKRLYKHESELMILDMITKRQVVAPSEVAPNITPQLEHIILKALEKNADNRFQSAQEMQLALETFLRSVDRAVNDAVITGYMKELFSDKIDEKRRLKERASRDDFEAMFLDGEATEQGAAGLRRTAHGVAPGHPSRVGFSGAHPHVTPAHSGVGTFDVAPVEGQWTARLLTAFALVVIVVAGTVLYYLNQTEVPDVKTFSPEPQRPLMQGELSLESSPSEAVIYLDGAPMKLKDGGFAKTPSDLRGLVYGRRYVVTLKKDGYKTRTFEVLMGEGEDGKSHHPTLEPFPGRLLTEVRGVDAKEVEVRYDGEMVGRGPKVLREVPGNQTVLVEASLAGKVCTAKPARVRVLPNRTVRTQVECKLPARRSSRSVAASTPLPARADRTPAPRRSPKPSGCQPDPSLPPGYVTIATEPYSTIYFGDEKLGETPISGKRLPSGCVQLRAVTESGKSRTVKVEVAPNLTRIYRFKI